MKNQKPRDFYLVPWSVGFQCFVEKPPGYSILVREVKYQENSPMDDMNAGTIHGLRIVVHNQKQEIEKLKAFAVKHGRHDPWCFEQRGEDAKCVCGLKKDFEGLEGL